MDAVRALAVEIGPRPACSKEERRAADYCAARLSRAGYQVEIEEFASRTNYALWYAAYLLLSALGALLIPVAPLAGLLLGVAGFVLYARDAEGRPLITPRGGTSRNVVARSRSSAPPEVIVMAHLDSARASLSFHPRFVGGFRTSVTLLNIALVAVPAVAGGVWVIEAGREPPSSAWWIGAGLAIYLFFAIGLLVHGHLRMPLVAGANDNASGVEVLLQLADKRLDAGVWFVVTGSEEVGMLGAAAFLRAHQHEIGRARLLNIDNVGAGELLAVTAEGVLRERRAEGWLIDSAIEAGATQRPFRGLPTDATVAMVRKVPSLTLLAVGDNGTPANWHWPSDVVENVNTESVQRAVEVAEHVVRSCVAEATPR